jgi:hypothetical protein
MHLQSRLIALRRAFILHARPRDWNLGGASHASVVQLEGVQKSGAYRGRRQCRWRSGRQAGLIVLYMVVEKFRNGDPQPVYARFRERGRMAPDGLDYVSSWVSADLATCYQVMSTNDPALLQVWMKNWEDLVEFEVHPVVTTWLKPRKPKRIETSLASVPAVELGMT